MQKWDDSERRNFLQILAGDVQHALSQARESGEQADKRNLIRAIISAAEGVSWDCRNHVHSILKDFGQTTALLDLAFAELTYSVSERGLLIEQPRFISITAMIRLTVNVAKAMCPQLHVDFGSAGWSRLKKAISIRNRITHPKQMSDLTVSEDDIEAALSGFFWLLAVSGDIMEASLREARRHADLAREIIEKLKSGDPETLALYHQSLDDEEG